VDHLDLPERRACVPATYHQESGPSRNDQIVRAARPAFTQETLMEAHA
jgi:hypothetical protein